jgi:hypothetical protein
MGQELSISRSSSVYHEWSSDASEDSLLIPHCEHTEIEMAKLSSISSERLSDCVSRRRTKHHEEYEDHQQRSTPPRLPKRHVEHSSAPHALPKRPDVILGPDHFRALYTAAPSPRPQLDALRTLSEPSPDAFRRHRRHDAISTIPTILTTTPTPQVIPTIPLPQRPRHHHRRSSHSSNPITFERDADPLGRKVRFHEEVSMRSVNGRRYTGKVEDNEWKGLNKGLEKRMKEGSSGV